LSLETFFEVLLKGTIIIAGIVAALVIGGLLIVSMMPIAFGCLAAYFLYFKKKGEEIRQKEREEEFQREEAERLKREAYAAWEEQQRLKAQLEIQKWREEEQKQKEEFATQKHREAEEERVRLELEKFDKKKTLFDGSFESLGTNVFLESSLSKVKREELFGKGYKRLKVSSFGVSGSAFYWVYTRHNESKEHAFFSYLIKALLEIYVEDAWLHTTRAPDVVCGYKGKFYCFDVETGSNWARNKEWVKRKFGYYKKRYEKSFIFVTSKKLKFKYSKLGIIMTRATLRKTIADLFKAKA